MICSSIRYNKICRPSYIRLNSQLINGISRTLQKLLKYFNGTIILTAFAIPFPVEPVIFCLNLNEALFSGKLLRA